MNWASFWSYLVWGIGCGTVGFIAGTVLQIRRQTRDAASRLQKVEEDVDHIKRTKDEHGYLSNSWRFGIVVAIVAATAVVSGITVKRQQDQADANEGRSLCTQQLFAEAIGAIKADRLFAIQQAHASLQAARARTAYLQTFTTPGLTEEEAIKNLQTYVKAEQFYITATRDQIKVANDNPLPTAAEINACK